MPCLRTSLWTKRIILTPRRESSRIITQQAFSHSLHPTRPSARVVVNGSFGSNGVNLTASGRTRFVFPNRSFAVDYFIQTLRDGRPSHHPLSPWCRPAMLTKMTEEDWELVLEVFKRQRTALPPPRAPAGSPHAVARFHPKTGSQFS